MSDVCSFEMIILKKDKERVDKIMFDEVVEWSEEDDNDDNENGTVTLFEDEANYGYYEQCRDLAKAGIAFFGYNGAGSGYGQGVFACYDGHLAEANAIEDGPVALVNCNGSIDETSLENAQDYYQTLELVKEYFKEKGIDANS